jgi:nitrite reductase/ring-hydroxylating ferredoxin subunit
LADGERVVVCASGALADGGDGVRFEVRRGGVTASAFAIRCEGRVYAYVNRCAHVGVELDWQPGRFFDADGMVLLCSTHGALYDPTTGACLGGPCRGGGLAPVAVEEVDGAVILKEQVANHG